MSTSPPSRVHPRFVSREQVDVLIEGRDELKKLWTENISKGGLYVATDDPPEMRARFRLRLETFDGSIDLTAEVVHVVDAQTAQSMGMDAGVGLMLVDLTDRQKDIINRYVDGIEDKLRGDEAVEPPESEGAVEAVAAAQAFLSAVSKDDIYGGLGLTPTASAEEVAEKTAELAELLEQVPPDGKPAQLMRIANASKALRRITKLVTNPARRLDYDVRHKFVRMEAFVSSKPRHVLTELRKAWLDAFPDRKEQASNLARRAVGLDEAGEHKGALDAVMKALEVDPLNWDLRQTIIEWQRQRQGPKKAEAPPEPKSEVDKILEEIDDDDDDDDDDEI